MSTRVEGSGALRAVLDRAADELGPRGRPPAPAGAAQKAGGGVDVLADDAPGEHADDADDHEGGEQDVDGDEHCGLRFGGEVLWAIGMVGRVRKTSVG